MIWMDVDTALSEVPVNVAPLIDDTDFKTIETAVAYNAAGLALYWHFVTTGGSYTATAVTPTTGGTYDWAHQQQGMYTIEIPASGGASINNDTEGYGWFTGVATGVLPWRGPTIGFRAAGLNNLLVDDAHSATRGLSGTALPDAVAGASNGVTICGSNAATTFSALTVTNALTVSGGAAITGTSGNPALSVTASGGGACVYLNASSTGANLHLNQSGTGHNILTTASAGNFMNLTAGATGIVMLTTGANSHGIDINVSSATGTADAVKLRGNASGVSLRGAQGITADITGNIIGTLSTLTTYTGNTPQTGDAFARLGAPAGASISADVAAVKAETAAILTDTAEIGAAGAGLTALATQASVNTIDDFLDTEIAAILADTNELQTDWANGGRLDLLIDGIKAKTDSLAFTVANQVDANVIAISGSTAAADNLEESTEAIAYGTVDGTGATTTAFLTSALTPDSAVNDQFNGRVLIFKNDTTTAALRGQATTISDWVHTSGEIGTFTVVALTTAPATGDTFTIL